MMTIKKHLKLTLAVCFCLAVLLQAAEINVAELGLEPDGKNDFAGILEKVMETIQPGDAIYFPAGKYYFTRDLAITGRDLTVHGEGTLIFEHKDNDPDYLDNRKIKITGSQVVVSDLKVTSTAASRSGVYGLVSCFDAENIRIRNLEISNSTSTAIYTISSKQLWIEGNYVHDQWADGIHISRGSEQVVISNNIIDHNGDDGIGIVSYHGPEVYNQYPRNNQILVSGNVIRRTPARGICASGGNITIIGNQISETGKAGIICTQEGWISGYTLISGNTIHDVGTAQLYGYTFYDNRGTRSGIHVQYNRDMLIQGNVIYNAANGCGVTITSSPEITVTDNMISNCAGGISADIPHALLNEGFAPDLLKEMYGDKDYLPAAEIPGCDYLTITNNTLRRCGNAPVIRVSGLAERPNAEVNVKDNILDPALKGAQGAVQLINCQ